MRLIDANAFNELLDNAEIEAVKNRKYVFASAINVVRGNLANMPNIDPCQYQWIPVTERLPEDNVPVNITWVNRCPEPYYIDIKDVPFTATGIYFRGIWHWYSCVCEDLLAEYGKSRADIMDDDIEVIAWMPLPKPYGGEQE